MDVLVRVFRLQNAEATEAARVLNEWFNGPQQPQGRNNQNPFAQFFPGGGGFGGGRGGFGSQEPAGATPTPPRVRIVAEQTSNSLLVKASQLDILTIDNLLRTVIDRGVTDSNAVVKAFTFGPLQYAVATEVVDILSTVYRESTNAGASQGQNRIGGGFGGLGGFAAFGARQQPLDALGRPKQVSLTIAADDRTNSIFGTATETMRKDIETLIKEMEKRAKDSTSVVELVPVKGVDPNMVQSVIDAIQGRPMTPMGGQGCSGGGNRGGFGGGGFPGGGGFAGGASPGGGRSGAGVRAAAASAARGLAAGTAAASAAGSATPAAAAAAAATLVAAGAAAAAASAAGAAPAAAASGAAAGPGAGDSSTRRHHRGAGPSWRAPIFLKAGTWRSRSRPSSTIRMKSPGPADRRRPPA